jgi:hypothetical protein
VAGSAEENGEVVLEGPPKVYVYKEFTKCVKVVFFPSFLLEKWGFKRKYNIRVGYWLYFILISSVVCPTENTYNSCI